MKFAEGLLWGSLITASAMIICSDGIDDNKKKMIKKGKQFLRKMGI